MNLPLGKRNFAITPKYPPIEAYITATEQASSKLPAQEADEFRSQQNTKTTTTTTQQPLQPQPFSMQSPHTTQKGQHQGGSYSGQGGGHGHHGPRRIHQQGPSFTTGHQHIQSAIQGSHHPT